MVPLVSLREAIGDGMEKAIPASGVRERGPLSGAEVVVGRARPVPAGGWASLPVRGAEPSPKMVAPRGSPCFGSRGVVGIFGGGISSFMVEGSRPRAYLSSLSWTYFLLLVAVGGGGPP